MKRYWILVAGVSVLLAGAAAAYVEYVQKPHGLVHLDQGIDEVTLNRYHYTDQGSRFFPAAWLAELKTEKGDGLFMDLENLRRFGFVVDGVEANERNTFGWPIGVSVSTASAGINGIPYAGFSCAMCHTGQLDFQGTKIRIEGGQTNLNLPLFGDEFAAAVGATAGDVKRLEAFANEVATEQFPSDRVKAEFQKTALLMKQARAQETYKTLDTGHGRLDAIGNIANAVYGSALGIPANMQDLNAPVNFPYLWDIWRLSWLQYNAFLLPRSESRNIGQVLGTKGKTNIINADTKQLNPEQVRWKTTIQFSELIWMEDTLEKLQPPSWPAHVLGPIDRTKVASGKELFIGNCSGCHGIKELPNGNWDVTVMPLKVIGTDPAQATNWASRTYDASKLGLSSKATAVDLNIPVNAVRRQLYADNNIPVEQHELDVSFEAPCGYKARPLVGVWATPPFLHNGSVRTLFELLSETRAERFLYGSTEFDPVNVGYIDDKGLAGMELDTSIPGNSNAGHWFTDEANRSGRIGRKLADEEKYAIIEYLKSATYDEYPQEKRDQPARMPCHDRKDWALTAASP